MGVVIGGGNTFVDAAREESVEHNNDITEYPVEDGSKIHSHAHLLPRLVTVEGIIIGRAGVDRLIKARDRRAIVAYSGRVYWPSLVIKELQDSYDKTIENGAYIRIVFQQIKIVGSPAGGEGGAGEGGAGDVAEDPAVRGDEFASSQGI